MLIATTTREGDIRLWDFEKGNFINRLPSNGKEITSLRFLDPYPLLIACDITGAIYIYIVRPHKHEN
jgi:WD40 repeat protein